MITSDEVDAIVLHALEAHNRESSPADQVEVSMATPLSGPDSAIDSLGFVSLISDVETSLDLDFGLEVSLADDRALSRAQSPYATAETLRNYILELVAER